MLKLLALITIIAVIYLYEWPKMEKGEKKVRAAFIILTSFGFVLSGLLLIFPHMPGPSQLLQWFFRPLYPLLS